MKPCLTALLALVCFFNSFGQKDKDIPAWGKIDIADLQMKTYESDKDADAVVLFDVGELYCDQHTYNIQLERRVRIKILKEGGLSQADVKIPYLSYRNEENITKVAAITYNLDAAGAIVTTVADKKNFFDKAVNKRVSEQIITFPDVKVGSVIEYKFIHNNIGLTTWYFQKSIPVKYSRYKTDFPNDVEVSSVPRCILPYESAADPKRANVYTYSMSNVPALRDEAYILNEDDYLQKISTNLVAVTVGLERRSFLRSWPGIVKQLMEDDDFGVQLKKDIPRTDSLELLLKNISDPYEKMKIIHKYVRNSMTWNGYNNIWALEGVKSAWKDKKGTSGEINLILVNLLKNAGLDAAPVLVSTHDNGLIQTTFPSFRHFNAVLAFVKIGNKTFYLDATEKQTPSHLIPSNVLLTEGLVIKKLETFDWGWQTLWNDQLTKKKMIVVQGTVNAKDEMTGEAYVSSSDYDKIERVSTLDLGKDNLLDKYFRSVSQAIKVDSIEVENAKDDSLPLIQKFNFTQTLTGSGDYKFINTNLFTGLEKNPFVAENRFSDVFFGVKQQYNIIGNFKIPADCEFEELPKNIRMIMPDTSVEFSRMLAADKNQLSVRIAISFNKPFYSTEEYPDFREFYKKLFDVLNEQIVYRRKAIPKPKP